MLLTDRPDSGTTAKEPKWRGRGVSQVNAGILLLLLKEVASFLLGNRICLSNNK